jgi:hypothetical protein
MVVVVTLVSEGFKLTKGLVVSLSELPQARTKLTGMELLDTMLAFVNNSSDACRILLRYPTA